MDRKQKIDFLIRISKGEQTEEDLSIFTRDLSDDDLIKRIAGILKTLVNAYDIKDDECLQECLEIAISNEWQGLQKPDIKFNQNTWDKLRNLIYSYEKN